MSRLYQYTEKLAVDGYHKITRPEGCWCCESSTCSPLDHRLLCSRDDTVIDEDAICDLFKSMF